jgi:hypothetical protein
MTFLVATLVGLLSGIVLGYGAGYGASEVFARLEILGTHSSVLRPGAATAGFLYVGPFGLLAGFLLGLGAVLRFAGGSIPAGNGAMLGGIMFLVVAAAMVLLPAMGRLR